jgi:hypothetical protein
MLRRFALSGNSPKNVSYKLSQYGACVKSKIVVSVSVFAKGAIAD